MPNHPIPQKAHGKVSVSASGSRWRASTRYHDTDGVLRQVHAHGQSKAEAQRNLKVKLASRPDRAASPERVPESSFTAVAESWWHKKTKPPKRQKEGAKRKAGWSESTKETYRAVLDRLVLPKFGELQVGDIDTPMVNVWLEEVADETPGHAKHCLTILRQIMRRAAALGQIPHNPVSDTEPLDLPEPPEPRALTVDEIRRLREAAALWELGATTGPARTTPISAIIDVALSAGGLRIGEVLGLRWEDVIESADGVVLLISGTVIKGKASRLGASSVRQGKTKNRRDREVKVATLGVAALGRLTRSGELIFSTRSGTPISVSNFYRVWGAVSKLAGLKDEDISFHSLRRTVATAVERELGLAAAAGVVGDLSAAIVNRHYVQPRMKAPDARDIISALVPDAQ